MTIKKSVDHLGNEFKTVATMCRFYNIPRSTFDARIEKGYSIQEALTKNSNKKECIDHLGNKFKSITAMCDFYNVSRSAFDKRIQKGYSLREALTKNVAKKQKKCKDHLGNDFESTTAMCEFYGISSKTYIGRIRQNWPQLEALTFPTNEEDPFPKEANVDFKNIKELCLFLNASYTVIKRNLSKGRSLKEIIDSKTILDQKTKDFTYKKGTIYGAYYNNKIVYVGKTSQDLEVRKKQHLRDCEKGNSRFYKFLKKFKDQVVFKEIESHNNISYEELNALEIKWIAHYDTLFSGYNSTKGGEDTLVSRIFIDKKLQKKVLELAKSGKSLYAIKKECSFFSEKPLKEFLFENNLIIETSKYPLLAKA